MCLYAYFYYFNFIISIYTLQHHTGIGNKESLADYKGTVNISSITTYLRFADDIDSQQKLITHRYYMV